MNTYKKYCPNVFLAKCEEKHVKGDLLTLTTRHGKENECEIHNFIYERDGFYYYSITRTDGFNSQERARRKAEKLGSYATKSQKRQDDLIEASNEGREFLSMGQPILVGHHSEKGHRALLERNWNRMDKAMQEKAKKEDYERRAAYWENLENKIDLSMPESVEYFKFQLEKAEKYHSDMKNGIIEKNHSYALTYAKKACNELKNKLDLAIKLWGEK